MQKKSSLASWRPVIREQQFVFVGARWSQAGASASRIKASVASCIVFAVSSSCVSLCAVSLFRVFKVLWYR
jgi:hypothetical protein